MYLQDFIGDKGDLLEKAMRHPALAPKRKPNIDQALKAVVSEIEMTVMQNVTAQVLPLIQDAYDMYTLTNGEYEDADVNGDIAPDEYASGLDDALEAAIEAYTPVLSADWLGRNTIDTQLWEKDAIPKLAQSMGKEVYKQLSYQKQPGAILSNAGIVQADVEIYLSQHLQAPTQENTNMSEATPETIAAKIVAHVGKDFDQMEVYSDLELACEDDDILAGGALLRLGLDENDGAALQLIALEQGEDTAQYVMDLMANVKDEKPKRTAKPKDDKPKAEKPQAVEGTGYGEALSLMKQHSSVQDSVMSGEMGVSRQTYNNWTTGKTAFTPDADQLSTVRDQLVKDINGLLRALAIVDGSETPMEVQ